MQRVYSLILIALALIALQIIAVTNANAAKIAITWEAPLQNTDGTALTDLAGYRVEWGTCNGNLFGSLQASITLPEGIVSSAVYPTGINPVCIRIFAINKSGIQSDPSNAAKIMLPGPIQKPITLGQPITLPKP